MYITFCSVPYSTAHEQLVSTRTGDTQRLASDRFITHVGETCTHARCMSQCPPPQEIFENRCSEINSGGCNTNMNFFVVEVPNLCAYWELSIVSVSVMSGRNWGAAAEACKRSCLYYPTKMCRLGLGKSYMYE